MIIKKIEMNEVRVSMVLRSAGRQFGNDEHPASWELGGKNHPI